MVSQSDFENIKAAINNQQVVSSRTYEEQGMVVSLGYVKLDGGWVSIEPCECPFCVHYAVSTFGSEKDKKRFNESQSLGDDYHIPMTRKEKAIYRKRKVKNKKLRPLRVKDDAKYLRSELLSMKRQGLQIHRRNKRNLHDGVVQYMGIKDELGGIIYLPAPANSSSGGFIEVISSLDELEGAYIRLWEQSGVENAALQAKINLRRRRARLED